MICEAEVSNQYNRLSVAHLDLKRSIFFIQAP